MFKSLTYYWRSNLALLLACAVACAVLTGALLVGDSVRGSLREIALDRLGSIDFAVLADHLFRQELADDLSQRSDFRADFTAAAPVLMLTGSIVNANTQTRASNVQINGVDERFSRFFDGNLDLSAGGDQTFAPLIVNRTLSRELGVQPGDQVLLSFQKLSDVHPESVLGGRSTEQVVERLRAEVRAVIPDSGAGRFGLRPDQHLPRNAYLPLAALQSRLKQPGRANALLVSARGDGTAQRLSEILDRSVRLEDYGLALDAVEAGHLIPPNVKQLPTSFLSLRSREYVLEASLAEEAIKAASQAGFVAQPVLAYLANSIRLKNRSVPYSTLAAVDAGLPEGTDPRDGPGPFGRWILSDWRLATPLKDDEIYLNDWTAQELGARTGDTVSISYYTVQAGEDLGTGTADLKVAGIIRIRELGLDRSLIPDYPGIGEAEDMSSWTPPFPVDLSLVRPQDEDYWDRYRATPKGFVNLATGQELWSSRFGNLTSVRFAWPSWAPTEDQPWGSAFESAKESFAKTFLRELHPASRGFSVQAVRRDALRVSEGATDFSGLFIGFSFFLILSAALLVGLLFRLGAERRVKEIGTLLAVGFRPRSVLGRFMGEGLLVAVLGCALGVVGGMGYAWLMMVGLRTWWVAAVGSPFLHLHITNLSLGLGFGIALPIIAFSIWQAVRKMSKMPAPALLQGITRIYKEKGPGRLSRFLSWSMLVLAALLAGLGFFVEGEAAAGVFFGVGACSLIAGLAFFAVWCRTPVRGAAIGAEGSDGILFPMARRNTSRSPGRSLLSVSLVASACFVIVAVGAFHQDFGEEVRLKDSGAGGLSILAHSDIPIHRNLNDADVRYDFGFAEGDALSRTHFYPFRLLPGDDASCLNLYKPEKPRVLGAPQAFIERGGFTFQQVAEERANPWELLHAPLEEGVIPAIADANSAQWILKVPLGGDIELEDESGQPIKLRLVGLLATSIFQSEVVIAEDQFVRHFPSRDGYSFFLVDAPFDQAESVRQEIEKALAPYGFDAEFTQDRLEDYHAVQNTYLSTFQSLGGLGLLLGTIGLGVVLTRNVLERRRELAVMRAFGFGLRRLARLVLAENVFLLTMGILLGTLCALLAVAPQILTQTGSIPWLSLGLTLALVFVVGMLSSTASVRATLRTPLLPALKEER